MATFPDHDGLIKSPRPGGAAFDDTEFVFKTRRRVRYPTDSQLVSITPLAANCQVRSSSLFQKRSHCGCDFSAAKRLASPTVLAASLSYSALTLIPVQAVNARNIGSA